MKQQQSEVEKTAIPMWQYNITWEILAQDLVAEIIKQIQSKVQPLCDKEDIELNILIEDSKKLSISLISHVQLNINKWQGMLQKKIAELIEVKPYQVMSQSTVYAKKDQRLSKLIESIREVDYYDLDEGLIEEDVNKLKTYLERQNLGVIEQDKKVYLVDIKALYQKINLNCFECTKRHQYGCCCGSPCAMSEKNMTLLDRHLVAMEETLKALDEKQYETLIEKGGFIAANGEIKAFDGHCAFLIAHEGVYKCMAHKYALDQQIPIYDLCPLSCLMYPLEIMEMITDKRKKIILVTAAIEEEFAERLSRWGSYKSLEVELRCIHKEEYDEAFRREDYKPVYEVNQGLLTHEFGRGIYKAIEQLITKLYI